MTEKELLALAAGRRFPGREQVRAACLAAPDKPRVFPVPRRVLAACALFTLIALAVAVPRLLHESPGGFPSVDEGSSLAAFSPSEAEETGISSPLSTAASSTSAPQPALHFYELSAAPGAAKMNIALKADDFLRMSPEELNAFYGTPVFPAWVPAGLSEVPRSAYGVYRRNGGTGELYFSQNTVQYADGSGRRLSVEAAPGHIPLNDIAFSSAGPTPSAVNGVNMTLGHYLSSRGAEEYRTAQFLYHNTGFQLIAQNLTEEEFVKVLISLVS